MAKIAGLILFILSCVASAQAVGQITFTPANPTSNDVIVATLPPQSNGCQYPVTVSGFSISITANYCGGAGAIPISSPTTTIGKLPAGTYSVVWTTSSGTSSATLTVAYVAYLDPRAPALSLTGILLLVGTVLLGGWVMFDVNRYRANG
ncbi:MAG: hypothetical protein QM741_05445 [Rudaea sp.]|uniref:hypothetical protein n=1 Tax=Rudaea sp. TaxID=2136325 RepID=UPI0039E2A0C3